jgi:hypothetical protein
MPTNVDLPLDSKPEEKSIDKRQALIDNALNDLSGVLGTKLGQYVSKRYDKEQEWLIAEQLYRGEIKGLADKKLAAMRSDLSYELPTVNITRPKTNIAISRLQDIQFPLGGDMNFSVAATPVPELDELVKDQTPVPPSVQPEAAPEAPVDPNAPPGEAPAAPEPPPQLTVGELAQKTLRAAADKAKRMEAAIHDRFVETKWAKKNRRAMEQMGIFGTAVMKAPVMAYKRNKKYKALQDSEGGNVYAMEIEPEVVPTVQWVDCRMWFPQPSARPGTTIEDSFELHLLTAAGLRDLAHNPAFMSNRIRTVLKQAPDPGYMARGSLLALIGSKSDSLDDRYSVMEYHGPVDKNVLLSLGLITEEQKDDPLIIIQGEVWFVNNVVIRVSIAPLEGEEQIPYFICTWEDDSTNVFGYGIPWLMRHAQRVVASSWLMLLDNAGLTAGPQIVLNKEMIQPANPSEGWTVQPMKVWFMTEYGADVNTAMQFVNVPTQQESIAAVIEMSMQFADIESSIPQIMQGDSTQANNTTFGGLAMVMSASHIIQQRLSERWDDNINVPIVERFYHYEMQYGEDDSIKGDFQVMTGGATERIDKQVKSQDLERIMGMAGSNPEFMEQIELGEAFREWVATTRVGNILRSRESIEAERAEAAQNPPPDPTLIEAQAKQMQAQAAADQVKLNQTVKKQELDLRAQVEEARVDKESREIMARERENQIKLQIAQMGREDVLLKIAAEQGKTQAQIAKDMQIAVMTDETNRLLKQADLDKFNTEIAVKREFGEGI